MTRATKKKKKQRKTRRRKAKSISTHIPAIIQCLRLPHTCGQSPIAAPPADVENENRNLLTTNQREIYQHDGKSHANNKHIFRRRHEPSERCIPYGRIWILSFGYSDAAKTILHIFFFFCCFEIAAWWRHKINAVHNIYTFDSVAIRCLGNTCEISLVLFRAYDVGQRIYDVMSGVATTTHNATSQHVVNCSFCVCLTGIKMSRASRPMCIGIVQPNSSTRSYEVCDRLGRS